MFALPLYLVLLAAAAPAEAGYQQPPQVIADILDARYPPSISLSPDGRWMVEMERPALRTLDELAARRVKVAGVKLDPSTFGPSRPYLFRALTVRGVGKGGGDLVLDLPEDSRLSGLSWHPDSDKFSFLRTTPEGIELWVGTVDGTTSQVLSNLNATYGAPCDWLPGDEGLICKRVPESLGEPPAEPALPAGPRIEENLGRDRERGVIWFAVPCLRRQQRVLLLRRGLRGLLSNREPGLHELEARVHDLHPCFEARVGVLHVLDVFLLLVNPFFWRILS